MPSAETEVSLPPASVRRSLACNANRPCGARSTPAWLIVPALSVRLPPADSGVAGSAAGLASLRPMTSPALPTSTVKRLSVLGSTCAALSCKSAAVRRLPDSAPLPTATPLARRSPRLFSDNWPNPVQLLLPIRSIVPASTRSAALPAAASGGLCWAVKAALLPKLTDAARSASVLPGLAASTGASSTSRRARFSATAPSICSRSLLRSSKPIAPEPCTIVASTLARPRSAASAALSPSAGSAAGSGAAPAPLRRVSVRGGLPSARPSPARVILSWPPALPSAAARASNRPCSKPPPGSTAPPARISVFSVMSSVPALLATVCRPPASNVLALPCNWPSAPLALMVAPSAHSSTGLRRLTLPPASTWPRCRPSLPGSSTRRPETSIRLAAPRRNTP